MEKVLDGEILLPGQKPPERLRSINPSEEEIKQDVGRKLSEEIRRRSEMMLRAAIWGTSTKTADRQEPEGTLKQMLEAAMERHPMQPWPRQRR